MSKQGVRLEDLQWQSWDEARKAEGLRWRIIFPALETANGNSSIGVARLEPGGVLRRHRHPAVEVYHVLAGQGRVIFDDGLVELAVGTSVVIPANVWHQTENALEQPLEFLFLFPTHSFADVDYSFAPD